MKDIADIYELTPTQEGMLFHTLYAPERGDYIEQYLCTLKGRLNIPALFGAWRAVIRRHAILRTSFHENGADKPLQVVHKVAQPRFDEMDWRQIDATERAGREKAFLADDRVRGFDLARAPLTRFAVIRLEEQVYRFIWTFHHILLDGWSLPLILKQVSEAYRTPEGAFPADIARPRPFREYVLWLQRQPHDRAENFWKKSLDGCPAATPLMPAGKSSSKEAAPSQCRELSMALDQTLSGQLTELVRQWRLTPGILFLGTFALLLSRFNRCRDLIFGITVSGRPPELPGAGSMIGPLMQTIPARIQVESSADLHDWLHDLQYRQAQWIEHAALPLTAIRDVSGSPAGSPLFEVIFAFENYPLPDLSGGPEEDSAFSGISANGAALKEQTHYPAAVAVSPGKTISINLSYDTDLYDAEHLHGFLCRWKRLLAALCRSPRQTVSELRCLSEAEEKEILSAWNPTLTPDTGADLIHQGFQRQVLKTPEAPAVIFEERTLTYAELNRRANRLARCLQKHGLGPDRLAAVCLERSTEMVVALLAVLKAGGGYVPIDPHYPPQRMDHILKDSRPAVMITRGASAQMLSGLYPAPLIVLPDDLGPATPMDGENPDSFAKAQNIAYVIYTSGSTGVPKGVMIPHGAIANHMQWMQARFALTPEDRVLQKTPAGFDASVWEFYAPLLAGAVLVMARPGGDHDPEYLIRIVKEQKITVLQMVPSVLRLLLKEVRPGECRTLRRVFCGGEILPPGLQERFFATLPARLVNLYGPTEACIDATFHVCAPDRPITIGRPIRNLNAYILDPALRPLPPGMPGELHIGGKGLARGYLNRPDLTAAAFIPHPFAAAPGERLYKTGDLARHTETGDIEFLGRLDNQFKINGVRIEAGEIEHILMEHPHVRDAAVTAGRRAGNRPHLTAYVAPISQTSDAGSREMLRDALRSHLKAFLPAYMIPYHFVFMETLPRLPSGKLNRNVLPATEPSAPVQDRPIPQDAMTELLTTIWEEVLQQDGVGNRDDFFSLGGNSLLVTRVISRVRRALGREVPVRLLFDHPTIAEFGKALQEMAFGEAPEVPPLIGAASAGDSPLSFAQRRLWFLDQLEGERGVYNLSAGLRISGELDPDALDRAVNLIIRRHETLRTTFVMADGGPVQRIAPCLTIVSEKADLTGVSQAEETSALRQRAEAAARTGFDLERGPLLRTVLIRLSPDRVTGRPRHALIFTMHHITADGWSMGLFIREFTTFYTDYAAGRHPSPADPPIQYRDYSRWQRRWLTGERLARHLDYWKKRLAGAPPELYLPFDHPRPAVRSGNGRLAGFKIDRDLTAKLRRMSRQSNATLFMTLLTAYAILLCRLSGQNEIMVGVPTANRDRTEIEPLIGFFVNTLVHRLDLSGNPQFQHLLKRISRAVLNDQAHQALPFERLVEALRPERRPGRSPLFQVMFALQNIEPQAIKIKGLKITPLEQTYSTAKFDLTLLVQERNERLDCAWEYSTDLFKAATIDRMTEKFGRLLRAIADRPERCIDLPEEKNRIRRSKDPAERLPDSTIPAAVFPEQTPTRALNGEIAGKHSYLAPRNLQELMLQHLWEKVLGARPIGVTDNFFNIGGHSLLAADLIGKVRKQFDRNLPVAAIFKAPTIEAMAMLLRTDQRPGHWTPLLALQTEGRHPPLFCIHPAGGGSVFYADLARHLTPEHPVYGLQPRGLEDESQGFHTRVEEMAGCYVEAVSAQFPKGPYQLAGSSFGGLVAFEMAHMLTAMGKEVALLALMDTYTPTAMAPDPPEDDVALLTALWADELAITQEELQGLAPDRMMDHIIARARKARLLPPDFGTDLARLILKMTKISVRAAYRYEPKAYTGDMLLFRAQKSAGQDQEPSLGWKNFVNGDIDIKWIEGTHQNILKDPQVIPLARQLKQFLMQRKNQNG